MDKSYIKNTSCLEPDSSVISSHSSNIKICKHGRDCIHPEGPVLPITEFYTRVGSADGYYTMCKVCFRAISKQHPPKPKGVASYDSEQRVIDKLRSVGIFASPGKQGIWEHTDVLAWGCIRVEVKTAKCKNERFVFPLGHKSIERFKAHDVVVLVCLHEGQEPSYHVFLSNDAIFYKKGELKNGVTYQPAHKRTMDKGWDTLTTEIMNAHENRWDLIETVRLDMIAVRFDV